MIMGVGSVSDAGAASLYMQMGANFVVTPVLREDIALVCNRRKVLWSPGCGSLGDIARTEELAVSWSSYFRVEPTGLDLSRQLKNHARGQISCLQADSRRQKKT